MVNSAAAAELRELWTSLSEMNLAIKDFVDSLTNEKLKFLAVDQYAASEHYEEYMTSYALIRDKVCEIIIARAFIRPETKEEKRVTIVSKALKIVKDLAGKLPPLLQLRASALTPSGS